MTSCDIRRLIVSSFFLTIIFITGCAVTPPATVEKPAELTKDIELGDLTIEEKVAQLFMIRYSGGFYNEESYTYKQVKRLVAEKGIGGVIQFFGNINGTIENVNELQNLSKIPILVAADYERGVGQQLDGGTLFPSNMALAATGSPELAYKQGMITAKEARAVGVHVTFAPVMDVNSNPDNPIINFRSFGDTPEIVAKFGLEFIKGCQENGLIAAAKHFPGHGNTGTDSHTSLPVIYEDKTQFEKIDLAPFKIAVKAGVKMIMTGHIAVPSMDKSNLPATLSPELNSKLLRDKLGYEGIIVTDALEMGGITESFWAGEAAIRAIEAGSDIVLLSMDVEKAINEVIEAVEKGRISEARIDESVSRIIEIKRGLGLMNQKNVTLKNAQSIVGISKHKSVANTIARKSITLVKDEQKLIPIPAEKIDTLTHILLATDEGMLSFSGTFRSVVSRVHGNVNDMFFYQPLSDLQIDEIVKKVQNSDFVLCTVLIRVRMNIGTVTIKESHRKLISALQNTDKPVTVVSFGSPYITNVDELDTYLCSYGYGSISQYAMADALFGAVSISGILPVDLSPILKQGTGINRSGRKILLPSNKPIDFSNAKAVLNSAIVDSVFPGAQVIVTQNGEVLWSYQAGREIYSPESPPITENSIYDIASLTKVVATTPVVMKLVERKLLPLDEPVFHFFPQFVGGDKEEVTIRHLLTHSSGLPAYIRFFEIGVPPDEVLSNILNSNLIYSPGDSTVYSDLGMILLGAVIEKVTGRTLDDLAASYIYRPLGMTRTFYNPDSSFLPEIVPTEIDTVYRGGLVRGVVHDENSWWLGGVAPHAGLFSTAADLAKYAQMMMDGGLFKGRRYFKRSTVEKFTKRQNLPPGTERALGWDTPSDSLSTSGEYFTEGSFGHLGFTGTSMWIDPNKRIAIILLTNRVYPSREKGGMNEVRRDFYNAVMEEILEL